MRRLLVAAAAAAVLATGCGPSGTGDTAAESPPTQEPPQEPPQEPQRPRIELTVEVGQRQGSDRTTWRLQCDPTGGDHPNAPAACETLLELGRAEAFAPTPKDMQCTMVFGGPQVATVSGHWGEQRVDARFARTNGCEISRWDAVVPLLPKV